MNNDNLQHADMIVGLFEPGEVQSVRKRLGLSNEWIAWHRPLEEFLARRSLDDPVATVELSIATVRLAGQADVEALLRHCNKLRDSTSRLVWDRLYPINETAIT